MGMSAGCYLAQRGVKTLLIDSFDPPHTNGSHHGETRLIRHAYTGSPAYTNMAIRADQLWRELEEASGETLLIRCGVLNLGAEGVPSLDDKRKRAADFGLAVEWLDADEIRKRWQGLVIPDSFRGLYEREAGCLLSDACVLAYRRQALAHGAVLLPFTPVREIKVESGGVTVYTKAGDFTADKLILSLGAWFGTADRLIALPIRAVRKAVAWFEADDTLFDAERFPGFTLHDAAGGYYGFPSIRGSGVKIGRHDAGQPWKPGDPFEPFGHDRQDEEDLRRALETYMPLAAGRLLRGTACKYEMTPDEHFIIDRHPEHRHVYLAGGFFGHGFKFASVVGEILADLVTNEETEQDIAPFALSRFGQASRTTE